MALRDHITAIISFGDQNGYVAECQEIAVVSQANSLDEIVQNLREAVALHIDDEDPAEFGLVEKPSLLVTFELLPAYA